MYSEVKPGTNVQTTPKGLGSLHYSSSSGDSPEQVQAEGTPPAQIDGLRQWLRNNLKGMQTLLTGLKDSTWYYVRKRWGPDWLISSVQSEHNQVIKDSGDGVNAFGETELSSDAWWLRSREGPPTIEVRRRVRVRTSTQGRPNRLRNPRSKRTRELCLLNRLRVHLNDRVLLAVGNEETNWGATVDGVPRLAGSYEIQNQRWARTLPRGPSEYTARGYVSRHASLPSRSGGGRHW